MLCLATLILAGIFVAGQEGSVHYAVTYDDDATGRLQVEVTAPEGATVFVMPRAIPMGYSDVPYDRYVHDVQAFDAEGGALAVGRERSGPRWRLGDGSAAARRVRYTVDLAALEREVLSASDVSKARPEYVGLLGYSVFGFLEGSEQRPVELSVHAPDHWPVFLTLAPRAPPAEGSARAAAKDFYALADSQVILGPAVEVRRFDAGIPLYVAQYAEQASDIEQLGAQAARALDALVAFFGTRPFDHYTLHVEFLVPVSDDHGYGFSMEHLESCTVFFDTSRVIPRAEGAEGSTRHLYNLAHHMAHAWIPKRCAGKGYFPWTWELSPVLDSIWFSEGWGQYAAAMALADEGGLGDDSRHRLVDARFREPLARMPPFLDRMSLVELSRVASTRYSEDFRTGRSVFARGGLMAYEIDEAIRAASNGRTTLRKVLRRILQEGAAGPLDLERIPAWCREETGVDVDAVFRSWMAPLE